jgi:hypothetical protein
MSFKKGEQITPKAEDLKVGDHGREQSAFGAASVWAHDKSGDRQKDKSEFSKHMSELDKELHKTGALKGKDNIHVVGVTKNGGMLVSNDQEKGAVYAVDKEGKVTHKFKQEDGVLKPDPKFEPNVGKHTAVEVPKTQMPERGSVQTVKVGHHDMPEKSSVQTVKVHPADGGSAKPGEAQVHIDPKREVDHTKQEHQGVVAKAIEIPHTKMPDQKTVETVKVPHTAMPEKGSVETVKVPPAETQDKAQSKPADTTVHIDPKLEVDHSRHEHHSKSVHLDTKREVDHTKQEQQAPAVHLDTKREVDHTKQEQQASAVHLDTKREVDHTKQEQQAPAVHLDTKREVDHSKHEQRQPAIHLDTKPEVDHTKQDQ